MEAIRALMVAKRIARAEPTQAINQARSLIATGPDNLQSRFAKQRHRSLLPFSIPLPPFPMRRARTGGSAPSRTC